MFKKDNQVDFSPARTTRHDPHSAPDRADHRAQRRAARRRDPADPGFDRERAEAYTNFRTVSVFDWHPKRRELLIGTRFADTVQVHRVSMPGGARTQLTFFPDRVTGALWHPREGDYFVFSKDVGGGEWYHSTASTPATARSPCSPTPARATSGRCSPTAATASRTRPRAATRPTSTSGR